MASTVTLRPYADRYNPSGWSLFGDTVDRWRNQNDNNDGTYQGAFTNTEQAFYFPTHVLAGNQRCARVRIGQRLQSWGGGSFNADSWLRPQGMGDGGGANYNVNWPTWNTAWNGWYEAEFSQTNLTFLEYWYRENYTGTSSSLLGEVYCELDIRTKPTVSVTGPTGTGKSTTPTITWSANYQGDSARHYILHIRRASDSALIYDSGWVWGAPGQHAVPAGYLQPNVQYAAIVQVSTDFRGGDWWSDWSVWSLFTTDPLPTTAVTLPNAPVTDTNRPTITWTYATSQNPQNGWHYKVFTADEVTQPGFNVATWTPITEESGAGAVLSRQVPIPLAPNIALRAFSRVQSSVSGWGNWSVAGPSFTVTASGLDKPARVFFAYSGGYNQGLGYYEFDDTKREGSYTWKSAPFRDPSGVRQVQVREVQLYVQTYDALSFVTVTVNGTARTVTFPIPGKHHCSLLFNERAEMLDVTVFASAATPALNEAPTIEVIRIGTKSGHQLR